MTEQPQDAPEELVRSQTFDAEGPLELDLDVTVGRVDVRLGEGDVLVEIRHDPSAQAPWTEGVSSLLSWVGERFGGQFGGAFGADLTGSPSDAVEQSRIEKTGNRLVVKGPRPLPLRNTPLAVTVHAPEGSHLNVRTGTANVTATGTAGRVDVSTGSGAVDLEGAEGAATVRTGSGAVKLGPLPAGLQLRSGSGDVEARSLPGPATLATGTGDVWLGEVAGEVLIRTSSGDLSVADAAAGSIEAITGSGDVRIGVRGGVAAEIDLSSGAGRVSSELDVADTPPEGAVPLTIRARTGSGDAMITKAAS
ncbi:DUF4097 family beta strand repeat-containing protein [Prauserella endophytica]|uniref:DUF4097 domain-containing protein n=1 Tax=Prauserella endophytica TaxID=1592324 RepID=A0ABY2RVU9_9PSEU|nr:DUF4097 family beta strand repeat-containing protein [Prauserella endophytica]PXY33108.1 hypothetical protein BAY59_08290 [Prauserella coralliicola]TKG62604.1 DUF4097 domain-containing protein [Prauserella endophytica]